MQGIPTNKTKCNLSITIKCNFSHLTLSLRSTDRYRRGARLIPLFLSKSFPYVSVDKTGFDCMCQPCDPPGQPDGKLLLPVYHLDWTNCPLYQPKCRYLKCEFMTRLAIFTFATKMVTGHVATSAKPRVECENGKCGYGWNFKINMDMDGTLR